ncbi:MAG: TolC family protein [Bacteroidales bacterium]|nr:TolC family protein [Bacteroidales bacterium]
MKRVYFSGIMCSILLLSITANAQHDSLPFTLKNCIEYSFTNNANITIYGNEVEIAKNKKAELLSNLLPQINGSVSFDDNLKRQTTIFPANSFGQGSPESRMQIGSQFTSNGTVQIDQTIFDQSIFLAIGITQVSSRIAELKVIQNKEDLIYNTATAYYQVLAIVEQKNLLMENIKKYNDLLAIIALQYEKGLAKKIDFDRLRVNVNNLTSQITILATNEKLALNQLKNTMGMNLNDTLLISNSLKATLNLSQPQSEILELNNKIEYKILNENIIIQELEVLRKKSAYLPSLSGYARFGTQALSDDFNSATDKWDGFSSIGLKLSVPIFSGFRRMSQVNQSILSTSNAKENRKLIMQNFQLQFQNSGTKLLSSYTSLINNKENLALAKDVMESVQLQYQKGTASLSDFLNSDYSYKEAQSNYIISLLNFLSGKLDYEKAQGTLSNYFQQL